MSAFANALVLAAEKTTAEEGRDIISRCWSSA